MESDNQRRSVLAKLALSGLLLSRVATEAAKGQVSTSSPSPTANIQPLDAFPQLKDFNSQIRDHAKSSGGSDASRPRRRQTHTT